LIISPAFGSKVLQVWARKGELHERKMLKFLKVTSIEE
jgi:hypothetical protein